jgi:hypothetical protein
MPSGDRQRWISFAVKRNSTLRERLKKFAESQKVQVSMSVAIRYLLESALKREGF